MNIKRFYFIVVAAISLTACTVIIGSYTPFKEEGIAVTRGCGPIVLPTLRPMPDVPVIPKNLEQNKDATDTILVNNIAELREYVKYVKKEYQDAATAQSKNCQ